MIHKVLLRGCDVDRPEDFERAREPYEFFLAHTDQKRRLVSELSARFLEQFGEGASVRYLDVGVGGGDLTVPLLAALANGGLTVEADLVEPVEFSLEEARRMSRSLDFSRVNTRWHHCTLEGFFGQPKERRGDEYDVIVCSHVLYYVENIQGAIKRLVSELSAEGVAAIVTESKGSGLYQLRRLSHDIRGGELRRDYPTADRMRLLLQEAEVAFDERTLASHLTFGGSPDGVAKLWEFVSYSKWSEWSVHQREEVARGMESWRSDGEFNVGLEEGLFCLRKG